MILNKIISAKKEEVARLKQTRPLSELKAAIRDLLPPPVISGKRSKEKHVLLSPK